MTQGSRQGERSLLFRGHLVASDGKAARHRWARAIDRGPLHMGSAWATASHVVLGQMAVEPTSPASPAIPMLRQRLERSGCSVTRDCQRPTAASEAMLRVSAMHLMLKRLEPARVYPPFPYRLTASGTLRKDSEMRLPWWWCS